jgi:2,3-dihydroxy-p-cumate/2,3-dihydroxybenzoate 3,4-dioxygenase
MLDFRYRRLRYVAVVTPDVPRSAGFLKEIVGLAEGAASSNPHVRFLRCSDRHHDIMLIKGAEPGLARISFEMESMRDLLATRAHLEGLGLSPEDVSPDDLAFLGIDRAFRIVEPHTGLTMEFMHGMVALDTPFEPTVAKITELGHIVMATPDPVVVSKFLMDNLNFVMSDSGAGGGLLRAFPNPNHHTVGLIKSNESRIAHIAFMVQAFDDIGKALPRFKKHDVPIVFGPGHHPASESNFLYFLDRDGITWEYTFGMEQFPEHNPREARVLQLGNGDSWGNVMDERMGKVGRVVPAERLEVQV